MAQPYISGLMLSALLLLPSASLAADTAKPVGPIWDYFGGANNDEGWGEMSPDYIACDIGTNQSPVGLNYTTLSIMPPLKIHYAQSTAHIEKKDRTVVIDIDGYNTIIDDDHSYRLTQMRIHAPAEHSVRDHLYPMELHLIHKNAQGKILIVGILTELGNSNNALKTILEKAPRTTKNVVDVSFDPNDLLPKTQGYYAYSGSLTWPPCTEGVEWRIFKQSVAISREQFKTVADLVSRNARLLQPIYLRTIKETIE